MMKRKTRTICFRVSEEDYQALQGCCAANGGRSVSDLARCAVRQFLANGADQASGATDLKLEGLSGRLNVLERAVEGLAQFMGSRQA